MLAVQREALAIRKRLLNPPNAVRDDGIDLRRRRGFQPQAIKILGGDEGAAVEVITVTKEQEPGPDEIASIQQAISKLKSRLDELQADVEQPPVRPPVIQVEKIQRAVCSVFNVAMNDLKSIRRSAQVVRPRQIAMYLSKTLTSRSLPEIGRRFGDRHHTTVLHAFRKIDGLRARDAVLNAKIDEITKLLAA